MCLFKLDFLSSPDVCPGVGLLDHMAALLFKVSILLSLSDQSEVIPQCSSDLHFSHNYKC